MKKWTCIAGSLFLLLTIAAVSWAMDYGKMSNEELFELRGAIQNAPQQDREAYRLEWEKRFAAMTEEEKKQFTEPPEVDDGMLPPPKTPARGYEKEGAQGQVIFGGFPGGGVGNKFLLRRPGPVPNDLPRRHVRKSWYQETFRSTCGKGK